MDNHGAVLQVQPARHLSIRSFGTASNQQTPPRPLFGRGGESFQDAFTGRISRIAAGSAGTQYTLVLPVVPAGMFARYIDSG